MSPDDDTGSVLILSLGAAVLVVAVLLVAVDVSALALKRRDADLTADGAARAAAQALDLAAYYRNANGRRLPLDPAAARARAQAYVKAPWRIVGFDVAADVVTVTVAADVELTLSGWVGGGPARVIGAGAASLRELR